MCCYTKYTFWPYKKEELWNGYLKETNALYALAKKMLLVPGLCLSLAIGDEFVFLPPRLIYMARVTRSGVVK